MKTWGETQQAMLAEYFSDPSTKRYIGRSRFQEHRVDSPLDALGERLLIAANILDERVLLDYEKNAAFPLPLTGDWTADRWERVLISGMIAHAETYWWPSKIVHEACSIAVPPHIIGPMLPGPLVWFTFQTEWGQPDGWDLQSILLMNKSNFGGPPDMRVWGFYCRGDERRLACGDIPYGEHYPEVGGFATMLFALLAFLNSPYTETRTERADRATRREYKRLAREAPVVRVVYLREAAANHAALRNPGARDWAGHWWVKGHIRAQWYPSRRSHSLIWIPSYVKGDRSKPLLQHVYAVVR